MRAPTLVFILASLGTSFTISSSMIERAGLSSGNYRAGTGGTCMARMWWVVVNFYQRLLVSSLQVQDVGPKAPFKKFNRAAS